MTCTCQLSTDPETRPEPASGAVSGSLLTLWASVQVSSPLGPLGLSWSQKDGPLLVHKYDLTNSTDISVETREGPRSSHGMGSDIEGKRSGETGGWGPPPSPARVTCSVSFAHFLRDVKQTSPSGAITCFQAILHHRPDKSQEREEIQSLLMSLRKINRLQEIREVSS